MHDFSIGPQQQPQHAVSTRVLRAHVDEHLVRTNVELNNAGVFEDSSGHEVQVPGVEGEPDSTAEVAVLPQSVEAFRPFPVQRGAEAAWEKMRATVWAGLIEHNASVRFRATHWFPDWLASVDMGEHIGVAAVAHHWRHPRDWMGRHSP